MYLPCQNRLRVGWKFYCLQKRPWALNHFNIFALSYVFQTGGIILNFRLSVLLSGRVIEMQNKSDTLLLLQGILLSFSTLTCPVEKQTSRDIDKRQTSVLHLSITISAIKQTVHSEIMGQVLAGDGVFILKCKK